MTLDVVGSAVLMASLALVLREIGYRGAGVFSVISMVVILISSFEKLGEVINGLFNISSFSEALEEKIGIALKIVGISYVFGISSDICRNLGEGGIEVAGRVEILLISFPLVEEIFEIGVELLG